MPAKDLIGSLAATRMKPITFKTYLEPKTKVGYCHITVPKEIVETVGGFGARLLCSINGNKKMHSGLMGKGDGRGLIIVNQKRQKAWEISIGDEVEATIELDHSKYGAEMPEELEALLEQDRGGLTAFEKITPGQQRFIIGYVDGVKSIQKRIDRAIMMIENLKTMPEGPFNHRHILGMPPEED
ncbi:MAG: DUF1905 domain-containing protein [Balneola sp.]|nr:MAG: DUF1905 domain-containing protein [Balneola sp.]